LYQSDARNRISMAIVSLCFSYFLRLPASFSIRWNVHLTWSIWQLDLND